MYDVRRWQTGSAHVRSTMYDVRLRCSRALRGEKAQAPMYDVRCTMYDGGDWRRLCTMDDGGRRGLPMYEVRWTMYDCDVRARCAGRRRKRLCTNFDVRRRRLAAPMYEVQHARRPQAAARQLLMYDLRRTMYDLNASAPEAREFCGAGAEGCPGAVIGRD